jgi:hypothetical protein
LQVSCGNPPGASATQGHGKHPAIASRLGFVFQQGVQKTAIAKIVDCTPDTLYRWMEENGLVAYIKSRKEKPTAVAPIKAKAKGKK